MNKIKHDREMTFEVMRSGEGEVTPPGFARSGRSGERRERAGSGDARVWVGLPRGAGKRNGLIVL